MRLLNLLLIAIIAVSCGGNKNSLDALSKLDSLSKSLETPITSDKYTSPDGSFKINFPGTPTDTSSIIKTDAGNIEMKSFTYEKSVTEAYIVTYSDYPTEMVKASTPDALLTGAKDGALEGSILDSEEKITLKNYPGYNFKAYKESYYMCYKIFLKENRLFQIMMIKDGKYPLQEDIDAFMNSFELVE